MICPNAGSFVAPYEKCHSKTCRGFRFKYPRFKIPTSLKVIFTKSIFSLKYALNNPLVKSQNFH